MPTDDNDRPAWDLEPLPLGANGHSGNPWNAGSDSADDEDAEVGRVGDEEAPTKGHWVTRGGCLWEEPETYDERRARSARGGCLGVAADVPFSPSARRTRYEFAPCARGLRGGGSRRPTRSASCCWSGDGSHPDASDEMAVRRQAIRKLAAGPGDAGAPVGLGGERALSGATG